MKATFIICLLLVSGCTTSNYDLSNDNQYRYQILVGKDLDDALKGIRSADYYVISRDQNNIVISVDTTSLVYSF